jgi:hypothetical protein
MFSLTVLFGSSRKSWKTTVRQLAQLLAGDPDRTVSRTLLFEDQPQERGLARAGLTDEEDELALVDVDGHVVERGSGIGRVDLRHRLEPDHATEV